MLPTYTLLGDVHGNVTVVKNALKATDGFVVQVGDLGFGHDWLWAGTQAANRERLWVLGGNHDDYSVAPNQHCYLGDFGDLGDFVPGAEGTFFVRGAYSIDKAHRRENISWWKDEELSSHKMYLAIECYKRLKPHTVVSHDCPPLVIHAIHGNVIPTATGAMLKEMFDSHEPERWYFGHHHMEGWTRQIGKTLFRCVGIDEALEISAQPHAL